jgi:hypothetical protein
MAGMTDMNDGPDRSGSNTAMIIGLVVVVAILLGLVFLWLGGYLGGTQIINVQPANPAPVTVTPGVQGAPGAPGAGGAGGAAGAPGAPGAPGAAGSAPTTP